MLGLRNSDFVQGPVDLRLCNQSEAFEVCLARAYR